VWEARRQVGRGGDDEVRTESSAAHTFNREFCTATLTSHRQQSAGASAHPRRHESKFGRTAQRTTPSAPAAAGSPGGALSSQTVSGRDGRRHRARAFCGESAPRAAQLSSHHAGAAKAHIDHWVTARDDWLAPCHAAATHVSVARSPPAGYERRGACQWRRQWQWRGGAAGGKQRGADGRAADGGDVPV
jgi:hypothetical protein